jgi:coproporphyrinogen III oxidase-like Fe-S oxidoreductase
LLKWHSETGRFALYPRLTSWSSDANSLPHDKITQQEEVSLYVHIPFCTSLCTFCGCNIKTNSKEHEVNEYLSALTTEWKLLKSRIGAPKIKHLYFGGGTPNFLSPKQLDQLITNFTDKNADAPFIIMECDPRLLTTEHLGVLESHGPFRISLGVQDTDNTVLSNVNRATDKKQLEQCLALIANSKAEELVLELIYGLPHQNDDSLKNDIQFFNQYSVSGITLYPLAHVPWQKTTPNALGEFSPPSLEQKYQIYLNTKKALLHEDFKFIGMGHYCKESSLTYKSYKNGTLHRSISGLMPNGPTPLVSLGVSAISQVGATLYQNEKIINKYLYRVSKGELPILRWHQQTDGERNKQQAYHDIIVKHEFNKNILSDDLSIAQEISFEQLVEQEMIYESSASGHSKFTVSEHGKEFLKNICELV